VGLNGGLALQKGAGMTQTLSSALMAVADRNLDEGALSRVLLSGALHFNNDLSSEKYRRLHQLLSVAQADGFIDFVAAKFSELPLPVSLSKMGVRMEQLMAAAPIAAGDLSASKNPRRAGERDLLGIMQNAF
jgi:alcohol dehydrogenase class IV